MLASFLPQTLSFTLDPRILWIIFIIAMILFTLISAILLYHWLAYSFARAKMMKVVIAYFLVSGVFILVGIISATMFSLS